MKRSNSSDSGCDITAFDVQTGIEPASVLCFEKTWRKAFPARDAENGDLRHRKALYSNGFRCITAFETYLQDGGEPSTKKS